MNLRIKGLISSLLLTLSIGIITPATNVYSADNPQPPSIVGKFAVTLDYDTGEIIYAKDIDETAFPASTTKVLTSLILAENKTKEDIFPYTESAKLQPEYSLYKNFKSIDIGDSLTGDDIMKSLLLFSANDAASMVADTLAGGDAGFANLMNNKVKELGLKNTHFVTPNGLHDPNHYSTAYDMAVILKEAYHNPWINEVMQLKSSPITVSNGKKLILENRNRFVGVDGNIGGKTGFTTPAGRCLVAVYEKDGRKLVGTVLNSAYDAKDEAVFTDMKKIMDYSFSVEKSLFLKSGESVGTVPVSYKPFGFFGPTKTIDIPMTLNEDVTYYENDVNKTDFTYKIADLGDTSAWDLAKDPASAKLNVTDQRTYSKEYSLTADINVVGILKDNLVLYGITLLLVILAVILVMFIIRTINLRKRRKRRNIF